MRQRIGASGRPCEGERLQGWVWRRYNNGIMIPLGRSTLGEVWASWKGRREEEDGGSENENEEEKRRETRAPGIGLSLAGNRTGQTGQDKTGPGGGRLGGLGRQALDAGSWELGAGPHRAPRSVRGGGGTGYLGEWRRCTVLYAGRYCALLCVLRLLWEGASRTPSESS